MKRIISVGAITGALALGACATNQFDRHFEAGEYLEAHRAFEEDSTLQRHERVLFRTGLIHALPASPVYEPALAQEIFTRLVTLHPRTSYRTEVAFLTGLLAEVRRLETELREREREINRLEGRIEEAREHAEWLEKLLARQELQADAFRALTERLEAELHKTRIQLSTLQEELDRLKEIDLKERRTTGQGTAPN